MTRASFATRLTATLATAVTLLTLSACGGSKSDSDKAKKAVTDFFTAVADKKGANACAILTDAAVRELDAIAFSLTAPGSCPEAITVVNRQLSSDDKKALKGATVNAVTVKGTHATVADNDIVLKNGGRAGLFRNSNPAPMQLDKVGGDWKIASLG